MANVTIDELTLAEDPGRWAALGFDIVEDSCQIGAVSLRFAGVDAGVGTGARRGIVSWALREIDSTDLDGLTSTVSDRPLPQAAPAHPNGVLAIDHVVAMTPDLDRSVRVLQDAGLDLRRLREEPTPAGAPRQAFFRLGREILELVQEPEEVIARAGGLDRPAHFWGLALLVEDLQETVKRIGPGVSVPRAAVQPGRLIATVRRSAGLTVPLALMSGGQLAEAAL